MVDQTLTARPDSRGRGISRVTSRRGDSAKRRAREEARGRVRRLNSRTDTTTTASSPFFVTSWGPLSTERRTTSLNCAFASWSDHRALFAIRPSSPLSDYISSQPSQNEQGQATRLLHAGRRQ